jgi:Domain of unknown function (DUF6438)
MARLTTIVFILSILLSCNGKDKPPFDSIIFHTTRCFGTCPVYHLELNSNKKVRLFAESVNRKDSLFMSEDTTKMGYFEGYANNKSFQKLSKIINAAGLDTVKYNAEFCCDAPVIAIIMYQNNKRIYLRSMFLPEKLDPLVKVLYEICKNSSLKKVSKKFEIERVSHINKRDINSPIEINNQTNH